MMEAALYDLVEQTEFLFKKTLKVGEDVALGHWCASFKTSWEIATCWGLGKEEALKKLHDNIIGLNEKD